MMQMIESTNTFLVLLDQELKSLLTYKESRVLLQK